MKTHEVEESIMINHIIDKLHEFNYYDTEGKTKKELVFKLATLRAMEIELEVEMNKAGVDKDDEPTRQTKTYRK